MLDRRGHLGRAVTGEIHPGPGEWPADPPSGAAGAAQGCGRRRAGWRRGARDRRARVDGGGGELPFRSRIQAAFDHRDISGLGAHQGDAARSASSELGAQAYAFGDAVAFASPPDAHTAAHEGYARRPSIAAASS